MRILRASRPLVVDSAYLRSALMIGTGLAIMSFSVGAAYVGGASTAGATGHAHRIASAVEAGFTEEALAAAAGGLDASALAIARRHDPYTSSGTDNHHRKASLFAIRMDSPGRAVALANSASDLDCLTQAAYYEARGEGGDGMRAVAQVVLNRVRHPSYPKSVCGVVFQGSGRRIGCQFSFTCDNSMRRAVHPQAWSRAREVAREALAGRKFAGVGAATHFHTTSVSPTWQRALVRVGRVGDHIFYRTGRPAEPLDLAIRRTSTPDVQDSSEDLPLGPRPYHGPLDAGVEQIVHAPIPPTDSPPALNPRSLDA